MRPPRVPRFLVRVASAPEDRDFILRDLAALYEEVARADGESAAHRWYWSQVLRGLLWTLNPLHRDRRASMSHGLDAWRRDFVHAGRNLLKAPGFAGVTVATLALAIGANTAIFSVVDTVLLDPLPFHEPDRLVDIKGTAPGTELSGVFGVGTEFYVQYRENATGLADLGLYQVGQTTVRGAGQVDRLFLSAVSPSLYSTLGVSPVVGRLPTNDDPEGEVGVLSHRIWTDWYGADPGVVGQTIEVSGRPTTIVGVMGPDFRFPQEQTSVLVHDLPTEPIRAGGFGLNLVGRLAPGTDVETLAAELDALADRLPERFGGSPRYAEIIAAHRPVIRSLEEELVGNLEGPLWILLGTVGVVLLIACANVANLLFVRAESRRLALAVRRALGAGRGGLVRVQMAEALVLAGMGAVVGVLLAWAGVPLLVRAAPGDVPRLGEVGIDLTALLFTVGVAVVAALLSGLLPALRFSNPQLAGGLRASQRTVTGADHLTRNALVAVQTAAALVLLVGSALLFQSFRALNEVDPGYETENVFTFQAAPDAREHGLRDGPSFARFHHMFMERLRALPGVESVGLVNTLPLDEGAGRVGFRTESTEASGGDPVTLRFTFAGGDYFETMGIRILAGEDLTRDLDPTSEVRVVVSRAAAERLWPGEEPLGKRIRPEIPDPEIGWMTVGGVVEDILLDDFRQSEPDPMVYLPMVGSSAGSWGVGTPAYVVRTPRAESIAPEVRKLLAEVAPSAPMYRIFTMRRLAARTMADLSFTMLTLAVAAGLALLLGAVGIYGTLAYVVSQRTREIGIRMALGARAAQVRRMVVTQGGAVALAGVGLGLVGALLLTRLLDGLLFGVGAVDPVTFAATAVLMFLIALLASYRPARRASSVDPILALRAE